MIGRCQGDDTFVVSQPMGIFRFLRNGEFTIFQSVYSPSIYLGFHPVARPVFRFTLSSSSLAILSARSTME